MTAIKPTFEEVKGANGGILTFMIPIDVPNEYEFCSYIDCDKAVFERVFDHLVQHDVGYKEIDYPYKIKEDIPVTCEACKRTSFTDPFITSCMVCNGSPETTLTVIDIQVINNKSYITEKADKDNPYGKRVLKNKLSFEVKVLGE